MLSPAVTKMKAQAGTSESSSAQGCDEAQGADAFPENSGICVLSPQDRSIRVWRMGRAGRVSCVGLGLGHAHGVGAVSCSR